MGFISKLLFRNRRSKFDLKQPTQSTDDAFQPQATDHQFDKENIRFVIFRDHDLKGHSVLFDSLNDGSTSEMKSSRNSTDLKNIADMMFGTLPLSHKATTLKVHSRKSPPQLMITKVFIPQRRSRESTCSDLVSFDLYSIESLSADDHHIRAEPQDICSYAEISQQEISHSMPLDVPVRCFGGAASRNVDDLELSTSGTHSIGTPYVGSVASLSSSYSSRDRRRRRHRNTTIEHLLSSSLNDEKVDPVPLHKRPTAIGVAVIFLLPEENSPVNKCFQSFFFSHIMLIENYVHRLKGAVDQALAKRSEELIHEAMKAFLDSVSSLYRAPRLKDPAWLSMMTFTTRRFTLSSQFLKDFTMLVEKCHTKNTKFFFGVLVTAVLTHHLSWAPTVAPVEERPSQTYLDKHAAKWVNSLLRSHPYNPLWAQLGDLYGAVGVPLCLSRTVIVGRRQELVRAILFILSYFIRCSEILENVESFPEFSDADRSFSSSETSSIVPEDETVLASPVSYSKDSGCACVVDSASSCTTSILKSISEKSDCQNCNCIGRLDFHASDLDTCQCCRGVSGFAEACEAETGCRSSMLLVRPSDLAPSPVSLDCLASPPTDNLSPLAEKDFSFESPSSNGKKKKSLLSLQLEKPCRLKEDSITESPKHECIRNVGSAFSGHSRAAKVLHHAALGDQDLPKLLSEFNDPELSLQAGIHRDTVPTEKPIFSHGLSMFDEYFESQDPDVNTHLDISLLNPGQYMNKNYANSYDAKEDFGDIVGVPCPDLSNSSIDRVSRTSANFESGVDFEESTELYCEHFGGTELENVACLPDGPSKQNLHKAISMLQDQFTISGHGLEVDCLCLNGDGMREQANQSVGHSHSKSKKKRHDSGQSETVSSNRCRSVTLSESSCNMNDMTNYMPVPMPSSSELSATGVSSGCIYLSEECNFGRSLLGDYCSSYTSHFVLHGTSDRKILHEPYVMLHQDLKTSVQNSVLDEPVAESTCIVADTDNWNVQLFSCKSKCPDEPLKPLPLISSPLVCNLIESVYELAKLKMSPEFCLLHLEDQLQSIYLKSQRLAEYIRVRRKIYSQDLATLLNLDINDMPLLLAISRTHSPQLFRNL